MFTIYDYKLEQFFELLNRIKILPLENVIIGSSIYNAGTSCNNIYITTQDICFKLYNTGIGGDFGLVTILKQI